jgi:hypothetical protein
MENIAQEIKCFFEFMKEEEVGAGFPASPL